MKFALCVENFSVFNNFYHGGEDSTLPFAFLNRDFCEDPKICSNLQVIPTVTIIGAMQDKFNILCYVRPSENSEKRLAGKRSIIFGGHIDSVEDVGVETITKEYLKSTKIFSLTKKQFTNMINRVRSRELKEELNIDLLNYQPEKVVEHLIYDTSSEVNSLHIGVNAFYYFKEVVFNQLKKDIKVNKKEIASIQEYVLEYGFLNEVKENKKQNEALEVLHEVAIDLNFEDWARLALAEFFRMHTS